MASNPEQAGKRGSSPGTTPPASREGMYIPPVAARRAVGIPRPYSRRGHPSARRAKVFPQPAKRGSEAPGVVSFLSATGGRPPLALPVHAPRFRVPHSSAPARLRASAQ